MLHIYAIPPLSVSLTFTQLTYLSLLTTCLHNLLPVICSLVRTHGTHQDMKTTHIHTHLLLSYFCSPLSLLPAPHTLTYAFSSLHTCLKMGIITGLFAFFLHLPQVYKWLLKPYYFLSFLLSITFLAVRKCPAVCEHLPSQREDGDSCNFDWVSYQRASLYRLLKYIYIFFFISYHTL